MTSLLQLARSPIEQLRQNSISAQEVLPLLTQHHLVPQLLGAGISDPAIAPIEAYWSNTLSNGFKHN